MANWNEILNQVREAGSTHDALRRRHLESLHKLTGRNVISYYSGWIEKPSASVDQVSISDSDKNGFMNAIHNMDPKLGLDLILHTPGGDVAATESIVAYLRAVFGTNIRAIVPQIAMSGGTMIACACKSVVMGKHSSLGPIDPQLAGMPAHGIVEEFNRAHREIAADPTRAYVWHPILQKYPPAFVGECEKAMKWAIEMCRDWLKTGMLAKSDDSEAIATTIVKELADHSLTLSHSRHIAPDKCKSLGIVVEDLEVDPRLQDAVLSVHHSSIQTLNATPAVKVIENHLGVAFVQLSQLVQVRNPAM